MHGMSIREAFGEKLDKPINGGLLEWHEGALRLTRLGWICKTACLSISCDGLYKSRGKPL